MGYLSDVEENFESVASVPRVEGTNYALRRLGIIFDVNYFEGKCEQS
mgnify:CR=1 FL=1